ncbi:16S rRNA (adenine(1518)-N(6)/adenine(1519)-N(6))-dimethyltransferase RsmA [uncultured Subdoligranulum sp.]|uniref:16S rRNA (adenine(1518)-N(6)/adenine(1519)-N(6))- dimethyltransferase RsmA n=1 Tax=uncultured Subdoligranulum sp. TaxID=512298 RepID=UPI00320A78CC
MPNLTDLSTIRDLCARYDFTLSKGFGQNFIINPGICPRIAEAAEIGPGWGVLEIGPGIGVLTEQLCKRADKVVSVEVDKRLPPLLAETMAGYDNFKLVLQDVLKVDLKALLAEEFGDKPVAVCANLPYYITSPILMRLLEEKLPIRNITVMVQREAAQRLCAAPGTREAGAISYAVAYYAQPKMLFTVQPGSFYPAPSVTSAVIRLDVRQEPPVELPEGQESAYFALIRAAFSQRRKTAANAIANGLKLPKAQVLAALQKAGMDKRARPEQLTLQDYAALLTALHED